MRAGFGQRLLQASFLAGCTLAALPAVAQTAVLMNRSSKICYLKVVSPNGGVSNYTLSAGEGGPRAVNAGSQWCYTYDSSGVTDCKADVGKGIAKGCWPVNTSGAENACSPQNDGYARADLCTN